MIDVAVTDRREVLLPKELYVALVLALRPEESWSRPGKMNRVIYARIGNGYRELVFRPEEENQDGR